MCGIGTGGGAICGVKSLFVALFKMLLNSACPLAADGGANVNGGGVAGFILSKFFKSSALAGGAETGRGMLAFAVTGSTGAISRKKDGIGS